MPPAVTILHRLARCPGGHASSPDARAAHEAALPPLSNLHSCNLGPTPVYRCWPLFSSSSRPTHRRTRPIPWHARCSTQPFPNLEPAPSADPGHHQLTTAGPSLFVVVSPDAPTCPRHHLPRALLSTQLIIPFEPALSADSGQRTVCRRPLPFYRRHARRTGAHAPPLNTRAVPRNLLHLRTCSTVQIQASIGVPLLALTLFVVVSSTHRRTRLIT